MISSHRISRLWGVLALAVLVGCGAQQAGAAASRTGCYLRVYDAAHLARHKGQIVTRVQLSLKPSDFGPGNPPVEGDLAFWITGHRQSFVSHGACAEKAGALACNGSLSAAEADSCKNRRDGIRDCREDGADAGTFSVVARGQARLVTITARLEVPENNEDAGLPFLYLGPGNAENHSFLLPKVSDNSCKNEGR